MAEINDAAKLVSQAADPSAKIIFGAYHDRRLRDNQIKITLIAAGFNGAAPTTSLFATHGGEKQFFTSKFEKLGEKLPESVLPKESPIGSFAPISKSVISQPQPIVEPKKQEKPDDDVWDIPTFLRKRRK